MRISISVAFAAALLIEAPARCEPLPLAARQALREVRAAARARDFSRLRRWMSDDFVYSFGDVPQAAATMTGFVVGD